MPPQGAAGPGAASLEDRVGLFDSIGNSIDSLVGAVKAIPKVAKEAAYYTYYTAKAAAGLATGCLMTGGLNALVFPLGMALGAIGGDLKNKEKITYKKIANELAVGGVLSALLHYIFVGVNHIGNIVKSTYGTLAGLLTKGGCALAQLPVFLGTHEYLNRALISDYKPKPLSNMWKQIKGMWPIIPPLVANFTVVPPSYQMPTAAGISVAYGLLKSEKKKEEKKEEAPAPYGLPPGYATPKAA